MLPVKGVRSEVVAGSSGSTSAHSQSIHFMLHKYAQTIVEEVFVENSVIIVVKVASISTSHHRHCRSMRVRVRRLEVTSE